MPSYDVITALRRDGKRIPAGKTVALDADEATPLLAKGAIVASRVRPVPAAPAPDNAPPQKPAAGGKGKPKAADPKSDNPKTDHPGTDNPKSANLAGSPESA
ncbi:hypothetical protein [Thalassobaculum sp.]|uniref:hypothetical protein n=1 Tax=Thalassobaculum sp. TaxID=2022740 RepID=UPI0032EB1726